MSFDWLDIRFQICNVIVYTLWGKKVQVIFATEIKHDCISICHLLCKIHKFDWSIMERARKGNSLISFTIWILQSYSALYLRVCTIAKFLLNPDLFWHLWCWANLLTYDFTDSVTTFKSKRKISRHFLSSTTRTSKESINTDCIAWQHSSLLLIQ